MLLNGISGLSEIRRRLPTTDLYFLNALESLRCAPRHISMAGSHIYKVGSLAVISRYATLSEINALAGSGVSRIVYLADDDFVAGATDHTLPLTYRRRLETFIRVEWPAIKQAADVVLVPSRALVDVYGSRAHRVQPLWHVPPADMAHFKKLSPFRLAFLGTRSHLRDLELVMPALAAALDGHRDLSLTLCLGKSAPPELVVRGRVQSLSPLPWWRYKRVIARQRFHLALYPLRPTKFNNARSANKVFEHAVTGAASLMSRTVALEDLPPDELDSIIVDSSQAAWQERILTALEDRTALRDRAERFSESLVDFYSRDSALLRFWMDMLPAD